MAIEQRIGRIDRIGQSREVFVFNLVIRGTLEEQVLALLDEKISMFELVVGEVGAILGSIEEEREFPDLVLDAWLGATEAASLPGVCSAGPAARTGAAAARGRQGARRTTIRRGFRDGVRTNNGSVARFRRRPIGERGRGRRAGRTGRARSAGAGALRAAIGWPEFAQLGFGATLPAVRSRSGSKATGSAASVLFLASAAASPSASLSLPTMSRRRAIRSACSTARWNLPNAVWRLHGAKPTWTRCLLLAFRYTAMSDEKREGLIWLGFNQGTGAVIDDDFWRGCVSFW